MGQKQFNFLQDHSARYLEMALRRDRCEVFDYPDGYGKRTGDCGGTVEMYLTVSDNRIRYVSFEIDGCLNTNACANTAVQLAEGKPVDDAREITAEDVIGYLETLPAESTHCAELAVGAFYLALNNWRELKRRPWNKPCRGRL